MCRQKKLNNEGLTLVELLICIMILAIVSTAVFSFMIVGSKIFNRSNLEVEMQNEAQVMKNYLNDLITDTTLWIDFATGEEAGEYGTDRCLVIYGEEVVACLGWIQNAGEIRYLEKGKDAISMDESGVYHINLEGNETSAANWPLMAQYVTEFNCSMDNLKKEHRIFSAAMGFELKHLSYDTTHTITLRNDIFYEGRTDEEYKGALGGFQAQITKITLAPGSVDKAVDRVHGTEVKFTPTVIAVGDIDTSVIYELEGNTSQGTRMEGDVLKIAKDENSPVITVICKARANEDISAIAMVNLASVSAVTIQPQRTPDYNNMYYFPNSSLELAATVEGNFATPEGGHVTWEIINDLKSSNSAILEDKETTCIISTGNKISNVIKVRATSKVDTTVFGEYEIYTADQDVGELYIAAENGNYSVLRGGSLQLNLIQKGEKIVDGVNWNITQNSLGDKVRIDSNGKVSAGLDIAFERAYSFTVEASIVGEDNTVKTVTCLVIIPKVEIILQPNHVIIAAAKGVNTYRAQANVTGIDMSNGKLDLQQSPKVNNLEVWPISNNKENVVIGLSVDWKENNPKYAKSTTVKVFMKEYPEVSSFLRVYIYGANISNNQYAPVPGDALNMIQNAGTADNLIPKTSKEAVENGKTYGYEQVSVNGVMYHYYVSRETNANPKWFVRVGTDMTKNYVYNTDKHVVTIYRQ